MKKAVETNHLSVSYDTTPVLRDISISIREGEFVSILGPNGSGKTTLIKSLTGIIKDIKGEVLLDGRSVWSYRRKEFARFVSFLPQNPPTSLPFLVKDIVMMGRYPYIKRFEAEKRQDIEAVEYAMQLMKVENLGKRHLMELSGGEVKRVFIAQAIAQESKVLFYSWNYLSSNNIN